MHESVHISPFKSVFIAIHPQHDDGRPRCSPQTRMLTRMLMAQLSKHMDMQSRRTLFCNSLFEQSCTYFPCYQSAVWIVGSVACGV